MFEGLITPRALAQAGVPSWVGVRQSMLPIDAVTDTYHNNANLNILVLV
jgi:hypothetical protein